MYPIRFLLFYPLAGVLGIWIVVDQVGKGAPVASYFWPISIASILAYGYLGVKVATARTDEIGKAKPPMFVLGATAGIAGFAIIGRNVDQHLILLVAGMALIALSAGFLFAAAIRFFRSGRIKRSDSPKE